MGNPYAHIARGNWCVSNMGLKYYFEDTGRKRDLDMRHIFAMVDKSDRSKRNVDLVFARICEEKITELNGGAEPFASGVTRFGVWMRAEFSSNGLLAATHEDIRGGYVLLAFPEEVWRIYRVQMMARHNLKTLPLPWF